MPDLGKPEALPRAAAPAERGHWDRWWLLFAVIVVMVAMLVALKPDPFGRIVAFLGDGIVVTVEVTVVSYFCILAVGLIAGLGRLSGNPLVRGVASVYVEVVRGIPLLVQLLFIYYASPVLVQDLGRALLAREITLGGLSEGLARFTIGEFAGAVFGLTVCYGAYVGEIYRAGIQSIPRGQMEAARSLGMSHVQAMRYVILPQAIRVILPPLGNEFVALLKDSSLVSVLAVADMTRRGREFTAKYFNPLDTWTMVALLYLLMTVFSARIVSYIEKRMAYAR